MTPLEAILVLLAGFAAGTINTIVGSGSLVTFPTLLAVGLPPVTANVSNTIGLVPGVMSGVVGYRRELRGQRDRVMMLGGAALAGGLIGGILLLALPGETFDAVVPFLILFATALMAVQPRITAWLARPGREAFARPAFLIPMVMLNGIYGGYFGAAQGVILLSLLGIFVADDLQRLNGLKNVIGLIVNGVAAILFLFVAPIAWDAVALIAAGSVVGGQVGAVIGRRLPPFWLRMAVVTLGLVAGTILLVT